MLEVMTGWKDEGSNLYEATKSLWNWIQWSENRVIFCERWTQNFELKIRNSLFARRFGFV